MTANDNRYNIRSVERALSVLSLLSDGKQRTLKELSEEIGINSSTIFRFLTTLSNQGFVERDGKTARYRLGIACLELVRAIMKVQMCVRLHSKNSNVYGMTQKKQFIWRFLIRWKLFMWKSFEVCTLLGS